MFVAFSSHNVPGNTMSTSPLNVLVVSNDGNRFGPGLLSGLGRHWSLFCRSVSEALESVPQFAPDLVLMDENVVDGAALISGLSNRILRKETTVIQLTLSNSPTKAAPGMYRQLMMPAAESEITSEITRLRSELTPSISTSRTSA